MDRKDEIKNELLSHKDLIMEEMMATDDSSANNYFVTVTKWKDGDVSVEKTQRGSFRDSAQYEQIAWEVEIPSVNVFEDYDLKSGMESIMGRDLSEKEFEKLLNSGEYNDDLNEDAISFFKENFDFEQEADEISEEYVQENENEIKKN